MFHNPNLLNTYLDNIMPNYFLDKKRRLIVYIMKRLKDQKKEINVNSIMLFASDPDDDMNLFKRRHFTGELRDEDVEDNLYPDSVSHDESMFEKAYKCLIGDAFARMVENRVS